MVKRVLLFLLVNLLVIATLSIVTSLLGLHSYLNARGIDYKTLAIFCAIWGTGGAFISLLMSRWIAKSAMGVEVIDPQRASGDQRFLLEKVYGLARRKGLTTMPEVGIYDSPELNAFATGPTKKSALVAVSSGLLQAMNTDEVEGVLAHEVSHVANGDMVTMTLLQGVINSFALFLSRIVAYAISIALSSRNEGSDDNRGISFMTFYLLTFIFDIIFTILGSIVTASFSRWREYRADAGGATLVGKSKMIEALEKLKAAVEIKDPRAPSLAALKISQKGGIITLFASHPPLEKRIERLQRMTIEPR
jgi:heat shock protein HtpX